MKITKHRLIILLVFIFFVFSGGMVILGAHLALKPEKLKAFLEYGLHRYMDEPVSIGHARLRLHNGLLITMTDFGMGRPEVMKINVKKLEAEFSPLKLFRGESHLLDLAFAEPELIVHVEPYMKEDSAVWTLLSSASIEDGSLTAVYGGDTFVSEQINGQIDTAGINLGSHLFGGRATVVANNIDGKWKGRVELLNQNLGYLKCGMGGLADIQIRVRKEDNGLNASFAMSAQNLDLPGNGKTIRRARLEIDTGGTIDVVQFRSIRLVTDVLNLSGIGNLDFTGGSTPGEAALNINLGSDMLDYATIIEYLPSDLSPDWLNRLLMEQIRDGNLELSSLAYNGQLRNFTDPGDHFYNHLYIKANLTGMSYGAGYTRDRITDLTGQVFYENGDLSFKNISGLAGNSSIKSVDLIFPDIASDGLRLIVNTDFDAEAKDFTRIWRAAMEPKDVFDLMEPLSDVTKGRIKVRVSYKEGFPDTLPQITGDIYLDDCTFSWSDFKLEDISGHAIAKDYGLPFHITLTGKFNALPMKQLSIELSDPLRQQLYHFKLLTEGPQNLSGFRLNNGSLITLTGNGKYPDFNGNIDIVNKGFELAGKNYIPFDTSIRGRGSFTGTLWPEAMITMPDILLPMGTARLNLQLKLKKIGGNMKMNGTLNAFQVDPPGTASSQKPLRGGVNMILAWGDTIPTSGSAELIDMSVFHNGTLLKINGPISISGTMLSTSRLDITHGMDTRIVMSGRLALGQPNQFVGMLNIDNLRIDPDTSSSFRFPEALSGQAEISLSNLTLLGFPFENAHTDTRLEQGHLWLDNISCSGNSGTLNGRAEFFREQPGRFDINIDLRNKGLEAFFSTLYSDKFLIDGYMRLKGHLHGTSSDINGNLTFSARDGRILKSSLMTKLFGALNFYKIIQSRNLELTEDRFSYNKIFSSFTIENNLMAFDDFYLDSNSLQFSAVGDYHIQSKVIDSVIGVQPLETIDRAVSAIPVIGWVLTGEGKKLIVISFSATGNINDPEIALATSGGLSQSVSEMLIRILDLPERLIDKSEKIIPGLKK